MTHDPKLQTQQKSFNSVQEYVACDELWLHFGSSSGEDYFWLSQEQ